MRVLLPMCALVLGACQSGPAPTLRALPTTLSSDASRLLDGCQMRDGAFDLQLRCADDVVVARQSQPAVLEAIFIGVADEEAHARGARVAWTDQTLATDEAPVPLRRASYLGPDGSDLGFLTGVSRPRGQLRDDLWCSASSIAQVARCTAILTALVQPPTGTTTAPPATLKPRPASAAPSTTTTPARTTTTTTTTTTTGPTAPVPTAGATQLMGRALSLPTTCHVAQQSQRQGVYLCDGHTLAWKIVDEMDRAGDEADALFGALPSDEAPRPLACRLGYETAVCRGTPLIVVGTAFVDGAAVFAWCVARDTEVDVIEAGPCRILLNGSW